MNAYSVDFRRKVLEIYNNEKISKSAIAKRFNVSRTFIYSILNIFSKTNDVVPKNGIVGRKRLIDEPGILKIKSWVEQQPDITEDELCKKYEEEFNIIVSQPTINRTLHRLKLSLKKTLIATEKERDDVKEKILSYQSEIKTISPDDMIFIDETGVHCGMETAYARAPQGARAISSSPFNKGKKFTLIGAISKNQLEASLQVEGAVDGYIFSFFIENILLPVLRPGQYVIMDNLTAHKIHEIRELIESKGAYLVYLPPYSPEFNPIEMLWSKFKQYLKKKKARISEILDIYITESLNFISKTDLENWFKHCGYYV